MFDPGGFINLSTLQDGYDSRTNHLQEGGNNMNPKRDSSTSMELNNEEFKFKKILEDLRRFKDIPS